MKKTFAVFCTILLLSCAAMAQVSTAASKVYAPFWFGLGNQTTLVVIGQGTIASWSYYNNYGVGGTGSLPLKGGRLVLVDTGGNNPLEDPMLLGFYEVSLDDGMPLAYSIIQSVDGKRMAATASTAEKSFFFIPSIESEGTIWLVNPSSKPVQIDFKPVLPRGAKQVPVTRFLRAGEFTTFSLAELVQVSPNLEKIVVQASDPIALVVFQGGAVIPVFPGKEDSVSSQRITSWSVPIQ